MPAVDATGVDCFLMELGMSLIIGTQYKMWLEKCSVLRKESIS